MFLRACLAFWMLPRSGFRFRKNTSSCCCPAHRPRTHSRFTCFVMLQNEVEQKVSEFILPPSRCLKTGNGNEELIPRCPKQHFRQKLATTKESVKEQTPRLFWVKTSAHYLDYPEAEVSLVQHDDFVFVRALVENVPANRTQNTQISANLPAHKKQRRTACFSPPSLIS